MNRFLLLACLSMACVTSSIDSTPVNSFIIGGRLAKTNEFPYQVLIRQKGVLADETPMENTCGGSILNDEWILTVGMCHDYLHIPVPAMEVVIGSTDLHNASKTLEVEKFVSHPGVSFENLHVDIGLVQVVGGGLITKGDGWFTQAVRLNTDSERAINTKDRVVASGYGSTADRDTTSSRYLRAADLFVRNADHCTRKFKKEWFDESLGSDLCVGDNAPGQSMCHGDAGNPLVLVDGMESPLQIGVASRGNPRNCHEDGALQVYVNVAHFADWIAETIATTA
jgi:secreted trypsin-like serine protease